jgi:hypothetical protein
VRLLAAALLPVLAAACAEPDPTIDVRFDPCAALVLVPAADATAAELASIDDAIAMWNAAAGTQLTRTPAPGVAAVPIGFEPAALAFLGVYDDESGVILVNRNLTDRRERAITIAHELGHAFGLWHVPRDVRPSVMNAPNVTTAPTPADAAALICLLRDRDRAELELGDLPVGVELVDREDVGRRLAEVERDEAAPRRAGRRQARLDVDLAAP